MIRFDARGTCASPSTKEHCIDHIITQFKDQSCHVFVFCHGWNNDWTFAVGRYKEFIDGYLQMQERHGLRKLSRAVLIGLFWPSTSLVFPWEEGLHFAGATAVDNHVDASEDESVRDFLQQVDELAASLPNSQRGEFYALVQGDTGWNAKRANKLVRMLLPLTAKLAWDEQGRLALTDTKQILKAINNQANRKRSAIPIASTLDSSTIPRERTIALTPPQYSAFLVHVTSFGR